MKKNLMKEHTMDEARRGIAATVHNEAELTEVLDEPVRYRMNGAVVIAQPALRDMEHIGLAATAIFNPFGPTVETLSLASFNGAWEEGRTVLLRRRLHPFTDAYIQAITEVNLTSPTWQNQLATIIAMYVGANGMSEASVDWAQPLYQTVPSGVIITEFGAEWEEELRRGFAWLFQNSTDHLAAENRRIDACGADFWAHAEYELQDWAQAEAGTDEIDKPADAVRRAARRAAAEAPSAPVFSFSGERPPGVKFADDTDLNTYRETAVFTEWWTRVTAPDYQQALHQQLPTAWHGATGRFPGLAGFGEAALDDFAAWWRLFRVSSEP